MNMDDAVYRAIVAGLRLVAAPFDVQRSTLPDFVHLPDEVLMAVDEAFLASMLQSPEITDAQRAALLAFNAAADAVQLDEDYERAVQQVRSGPQFEQLRRLALASLHELGEQYSAPRLDGVIYLQGASET